MLPEHDGSHQRITNLDIIKSAICSLPEHDGSRTTNLNYVVCSIIGSTLQLKQYKNKYT